MLMSKVSLRFFCCFFVLLIGLKTSVWAESGRDDYDVDDDGLIEINDWADMDEIRNDEEGESLYDESVGCPDDGCFGYELMVDLDFDTNGDGEISEDDDYWNDGAGWKPIGNLDPNDSNQDDPANSENPDQAFSAIFEGNNHTISNLYVRGKLDDTLQSAGLFGGLQGDADDPDTEENEEEAVEIRNLHFRGNLTEIFGNSASGTLAGAAGGAEITNVTVEYSEVSTPAGPTAGLIGAAQLVRLKESSFVGVIFGDDDTGGLIGNAQSVEIIDSSAQADIFGDDSTGGLVGYASGEVGIFTSYLVNGDIDGDDNVGGIIGYAGENIGIDNTYAHADIAGENNVGGLIGFIEDEMKIGRSYLNGDIDATGDVGGLIGYVYPGADVEMFVSYWTLDKSDVEDAVGYGSVDGEGFFSASEKELKCAVTFGSKVCKAAFPLYIEWDDEQDVWDLGNGSKWPALIFDGVVQRDIDDDGILDRRHLRHRNNCRRSLRQVRRPEPRQPRLSCQRAPPE